ncbi:MAG: dienelactone hydrolase family protein [Alphaproteobacteria bacterium]|nr:dienelactone hydrolase family protein [Alphaproteobacteria bacterium]
MIIKEHAFADIATPTGPMRLHLFQPAAPGRYPGLLLYSEIYQITGPVRRMAAFLAGQGFLVGAPEVYHEFEDAGTVLAYDTAGTDRGNALKYEKEVAAFDGDARAGLDFLAAHPDCTGRLGVVGICLGGHLAFRAAMNPEVRAAACFYATDIHTGSLGKGQADDSLAQADRIAGELLCVWGRQDPHIPLDGRTRIRQRLEEAGTQFTWHEFNAAHAFMRDEGPRYDPALAYRCYGLIIELFQRRLGGADLAD